MLASVFGQAASAAEATDAGSVLLLRGGGVLAGRIERVGDRYRVTRDHSQFDVAADAVLLTARSLGDAYEQQRNQLPRDSADAHLALADWCLRYSLLAEGRRELEAARAIDPRHPQLALLERHVTATERAAANRPPAIEPSESGVEPSRADQRTLEAVAAELPPGAVERFARRVQPLLVNSCTTAGCHQPGGEQSFQLDRAVVHGLSNRRTTLRNLVATLKLVDRARPQVSPLLTVPRQSHGGLRQPVFGPRQEAQLNQLVDWVALVTDAESEAALPTRPTAINNPPAVVRTAHLEEQPTLRPKQPLRHGTQIAPWRPRDEFDPEIFNRQHQPVDDPSPAAK